MRNQKRLLFVSLFVLALVTPSFAQGPDLSGHWEGGIHRGSSTGNVKLDLQIAGSVITGTLYDPSGQTLQIRDGKVAQNGFTFDVTGDQHGQPKPLHFVGNLQNGVIHMHTAGNGATHGPDLTLQRHLK